MVRLESGAMHHGFISDYCQFDRASIVESVLTTAGFIPER